MRKNSDPRRIFAASVNINDLTSRIFSRDRRAIAQAITIVENDRADMRELINTTIKFREKFRRFAPSSLEEAMDEYFVGAETDPFMQQVYPVRLEKRDILPAITHVDGC